jgi:hypothetical protein
MKPIVSLGEELVEERGIGGHSPSFMRGFSTVANAKRPVQPAKESRRQMSPPDET